VLITEFSYFDVPHGDWFVGMCTKPNKRTGLPPVPFEPFRFFIPLAPEHEFEVFHVP